jgi:hypothetical protein
MALTEKDKRKIEEEEKYRHAVAASISQPKTVAPQKHGVPLLLSFIIPGLGQLVKGQIKKGLLIFFSPIVGFLLFIILGFLINNSAVFALMGYLWLGTIILYIWQLIDAYNNKAN